MCPSGELCRVPLEALNNMSCSLYRVDVGVTRLFRVFEKDLLIMKYLALRNLSNG